MTKSYIWLISQALHIYIQKKFIFNLHTLPQVLILSTSSWYVFLNSIRCLKPKSLQNAHALRYGMSSLEHD